MMSSTGWNAGHPDVRAADLAYLTPVPYLTPVHHRVFNLPDLPGDGPDWTLSRSEFQDLLDGAISSIAVPLGVHSLPVAKHDDARARLKRSA